MIYSLEYTKQAFGQLKNLDLEAQTRILSTLERCRIRPYAYLKKLIGCPYFRLRAWKYRVIVNIVDKYHGLILTSNEEKTTITIKIPI